jgi:hypothetical protein
MVLDGACRASSVGGRIFGKNATLVLTSSQKGSDMLCPRVRQYLAINHMYYQPYHDDGDSDDVAVGREVTRGSSPMPLT